jgi:hypothetical protein
MTCNGRVRVTEAEIRRLHRRLTQDIQRDIDVIAGAATDLRPEKTYSSLAKRYPDVGFAGTMSRIASIKLYILRLFTHTSTPEQF